MLCKIIAYETHFLNCFFQMTTINTVNNAINKNLILLLITEAIFINQNPSLLVCLILVRFIECLLCDMRIYSFDQYYIKTVTC